VNPTAIPGLGIISTMITPAVLILAAGNLVTSTFTRLVRISDRARAMMGILDAARARGDEATIELYTRLLHAYRRRSVLAERALSSYYLSIGLLVLASLSIAANRMLNDRFPWVPVGITVIGATVLLVGTVSLYLETRITAGALRDEIELHERQSTEVSGNRQKSTEVD